MKNNNQTIFYFPDFEKEEILENHFFYVSEAISRVFNQFSDVGIKSEADDLSGDYFKEASKKFDPDRDDPADVYEKSYHVGLSHWIALTEMRKSVILAVVAGMFHSFDKALRNKVVVELSSCPHRDAVGAVVWGLTFHQLIELLDALGLDISGKSFLEKLDLCRLVVNVYKHGEGQAHDELSFKAPQYYSQFKMEGIPDYPPRYYELNVDEVMFRDFAQAITDFWQSIPERSLQSQLKGIPNWFQKKIKAQEKRL
ncbi:hypothetical protein ACVTTK_05440 [Alcaligenes nematophilus]